MSFSEHRQDVRHEMAELRRALDPERAALIRVIQLMELLMSKQLDDLTSGLAALSAAVTALIGKVGSAGPDETAALEKIASGMQDLVTQINAALAPPPPAPGP